MSVNDSIPASADRLSEFPTFDLSYAVDDDPPREVTVFEEPADLGGTDELPVSFATGWISVDADHAVALEDVA